MKSNRVRKKRSSAPSKKQGRQRLAILEHAGDWVLANQWVNIGLTRNQVKLLSTLGKAWRIKEAPAATAARFLLCAALADLPRMKARLEAIEAYLNSEGFASDGLSAAGFFSCGRYFDRLAKTLLESEAWQ